MLRGVEMSMWLYINILLFSVVLFSVSYPLTELPIHVLVGLAGLFLVLFNWTRHAFFSTIRNTHSRKKKIRLANISKRILPFHRWIGTTALLLILLHAGLVIQKYGFIGTNIKVISGILAGIALGFMVLTGWLRFYLPSGKKRRAHIFFGFLLFFLVAVHTVIF